MKSVWGAAFRTNSRSIDVHVGLPPGDPWVHWDRHWRDCGSCLVCFGPSLSGHGARSGPWLRQLFVSF